MPTFVVGLWASAEVCGNMCAKTSSLAQQCDSERGISANIWPSGGAKVSSTCWCHYCKMGVTFTKARPSQHPNTVKGVERGGREADKEEREWITHLGECKWLILMFCGGWCWARSFMSAFICCWTVQARSEACWEREKSAGWIKAVTKLVRV